MTGVDLTLPDQIGARLGTSVLVVPGGHGPNTEAPAEFVDARPPRLPVP